MAITHITEADAARDLAGILKRVAAGEHVQIDKDLESFMIVSVRANLSQPRLLSEMIAAMDEASPHVTLDDQFGNDLEEVIRLHEHESLRDPWESF